jgi:hypothetical protein
MALTRLAAAIRTGVDHELERLGHAQRGILPAPEEHEAKHSCQRQRRRASLLAAAALRLRGLPRHEHVVRPPARTAGQPDEVEAGASDQDQCDRTYVMLVKSLLRRQAGEADPVGGSLVDGIGDALRQMAHVVFERRCNVAATMGPGRVVAQLRASGIVGSLVAAPGGQF